MPAAALPIAKGIGAAGTAASGASGKKASNAANNLAQQQLQLQQQQFGLAKGQVGAGNAAITPSTNYWKALLGGGQAAVQATGPIASQIGQVAEGSRGAIQALTPRGGEQNLALAQNYNNQSNNIARLYAGMQPLAASQLANNAGMLFGSGAAFNPSASPGAAAGIYGQEMQSAGQAGQGFGSLLYNAMNKARQGGGSAGKGGSIGPIPAVG